MGSFPLFDSGGAFKEHFEFDESVFGEEVSEKLLRTAVHRCESNRRQGNAKTKERSEIKGSTKKPWRQKGIGRARAGTRKSPLWRGGGTIFGPRPRSFRQKLNRKARRAAVRQALLSKFRDREVLLIEKFEIPRPRTADAAQLLKNIGVREGIFVGIESHDPVVWKSFRNIPRVEVLPATEASPLAFLRRKKVLFTLGALQALRKKYGPDPAQEKEAGA
jgi:large subunit ribosomal protein L4